MMKKLIRLMLTLGIATNMYAITTTTNPYEASFAKTEMLEKKLQLAKAEGKPIDVSRIQAELDKLDALRTSYTSR